MKKLTLSILALAAIMHYVSCSKDSTSATSTTVDCTGVSAKFAADVLPIISGTKCTTSGCHPDNGILTTYAAVKSHVDQGHMKTYVVDKTSKPMPPSGSTQLTSDELKKIACWIQSGALDN